MNYLEIRKFWKSKLILSTKILLFFVLAGAVFQSSVYAQNSQSSPASNAAPAASVTPTLAPTPIPFSEIIAQSDQAVSTLGEISASAATDPVADAIERDLPKLTSEINAKLEETAQAVENRASLEKLRNFETDWRALAKNPPGWKDDLTARARKLEADSAQLKELQNKWQRTVSELTEQQAPPEVSARIKNVLALIDKTRRQVESQQSRVVGLQDRVAEQQKRIDAAGISLRRTREALVGQLFVQDSPPVWSREVWTNLKTGELVETSRSLAGQSQTLEDFVVRNRLRLILHLLVFVLLAGVLLALRRAARRAVEKDEALKNAAVVFDLPVATALILSVLLSSQFYPQTPQVLSAIFGAVAIIPAIIILRRLIGRALYPVLYWLIAFYFLDLVRAVSDAQASISRGIFIAEMLGGFVFFLWLRRTRLTGEAKQNTRRSRFFRTIKTAAYIALPVFAFAFIADAFGYVTLARLLGNAVLRSSYAALMLYAIVRIADGLVIFALRFRPLCLLKMVQKYHQPIQKRIRKFLRWAAFIIWITITLEFLTLREPFFEKVSAILTAELSIGSLSISLGDILLFAFVVWAAFALSRFVRFALEEDVYPRVALERGLPYAISTLLNYTILLGGFFLAVGAAGFDLSKFTILAGAFGVGIGFGLQNIVNNFVSGLILLFERPVKVGDIVKIGDAVGTVKNIGIRASTVHSWDNSDVIVPNSKLISDNVTNWTFTTQQRGIEIVFSISPSAARVSSPKVIEIMENAALEHPLVAKEPHPQVLFEEVLFDRLTFKLRVWTDYFDKVAKIRSELVLNVSEALSAENIRQAAPEIIKSENS